MHHSHTFLKTIKNIPYHPYFTQNHQKHSLSHISPKPSLHISSKPYRNSKLSISQGWKFALSLFTLLLKKLLSLQSDHERFALVTRASCSFLRANCTFAFLLSKNEQFASKIGCFRHVFDSFSLLFPVFCPRVSLFCKERQEGFAFGKEQITILLFHSQKTSNSHKKTKERIPNPGISSKQTKTLVKVYFFENILIRLICSSSVPRQVHVRLPSWSDRWELRCCD